MDIYYDTEFLENGETIRLISIGMVREDNQEYYAVVDDLELIKDAAKHPWLRANVLPYLPLAKPIDPKFPVWDESHPDYANVKSRSEIAKEVLAFVVEYANPSLWAYFASYDHVVLAQLYGRMIDMPFVQRSNDVVQEMERLNYNPGRKNDSRHNALADAREVKWMREKIQMYEALSILANGGK
jgi:hypothetical protein